MAAKATGKEQGNGAAQAQQGANVRFGYARVSTTEQNLDRQTEALEALGIDPANIFTDKISGAKESRPALDDMLSRLRPGDSVTVLSFDRLARSTKQLLSLSERFQASGVDLISIKEQIDTSTPQGKLFFTISSAFAEFEREIIKQRQAEGIAIAKEQGRMKGRPHVDAGKLQAALALYSAGEMTVSEIEKTTGISRATIYREAKAQGAERPAGKR